MSKTQEPADMLPPEGLEPIQKTGDRENGELQAGVDETLISMQADSDAEVPPAQPAFKQVEPEAPAPENIPGTQKAVYNHEPLPPPGPPYNTLASVGIGLGIVGWVLFVFAFFGTALSLGVCVVCTTPITCLTPALWLMGIVFCGIGLSEVKKGPSNFAPNSNTVAIIGLIINGAGILISLCSLIAIIFAAIGAITIPILAIPWMEGLEGIQIPTPPPLD